MNKKIEHSQQLLDKVKELFYVGYGSKYISEQCNITVRKVQLIYKYLNLPANERRCKKIIHSKETINKVKILFKKGLSFRKIAKELNINRSQIERLCGDLKLPAAERRKKKVFSKRIINKIKKMYESGIIQKEISKQLNIKVGYIQVICKELNLDTKRKKKPINEEIAYKVKELFNNKYGVKKISKKLSISTKKVLEIYKYLNLPSAERKRQKIKHSQEIINKVLEMFNNGDGKRKIGKELDITRKQVSSIYKDLGVSSTGRKPKRTAHLKTEKICKNCPQNGTQLICNFRKRYNKKTDRISYDPYCKLCTKIIYNEYAKRRAKQRRIEDPAFRLKKNVSWAVWDHLKERKAVKNGSAWKHIGYTPQQLRNYIEALFSHPDNLIPKDYPVKKLRGKVWMNWDNQGIYNSKTWDDNDLSTWTWQLDHIVPHSEFEYISLQDPLFKECWALSNLQPLCAKKNNEDGVNRTRHTKKKAA